MFKFKNNRVTFILCRDLEMNNLSYRHLHDGQAHPV